MDPKATAYRMLRALLAGDKDEAREAYEDYKQWRERGGFDAPMSAGELVAELSNYI